MENNYHIGKDIQRLEDDVHQLKMNVVTLAKEIEALQNTVLNREIPDGQGN